MMQLTIHDSVRNMHTVSIGNHRDVFYFSNADHFNAIIFYSIFFYNNFEVDYAVDSEFWNTFLDFFNTSFGTNKKIKFHGDGLPIDEGKKTEERILYSKGKDSHHMRTMYNHNKKTLQLYSSIAYEKWADELIVSNIDDLFWAKLPRKHNYRLEMFLPIISPYNSSLIGVEKELWDNSSLVFGFSLQKYYDLLSQASIFIDSPIKELYGVDIAKNLYDNGLHDKYYKCNKTLDKQTEYCYLCSKCFFLYFSGADESMGFDRDRINRYFDVKTPVQLIKALKKAKMGQIEKYESIYLQLMDNFL